MLTDFYPDSPEDWIEVTEEASHGYLLPTIATNVAWRTTYTLAEASGPVVPNAPSGVKQAIWPSAIWTLSFTNMSTLRMCAWQKGLDASSET